MVVQPPCVSGIKSKGERDAQNVISFLSHPFEACSVSYCTAAGIERYTQTKKKQYEEVSIFKMRRKEQGKRPIRFHQIGFKIAGRELLG